MARNQCDGCGRGLPLARRQQGTGYLPSLLGVHLDPKTGGWVIGCTAHLYMDNPMKALIVYQKHATTPGSWMAQLQAEHPEYYGIVGQHFIDSADSLENREIFFRMYQNDWDEIVEENSSRNVRSMVAGDFIIYTDDSLSPITVDVCKFSGWERRDDLVNFARIIIAKHQYDKEKK